MSKLPQTTNNLFQVGFPTESEFGMMRSIAQTAIKSGLLPTSIKTAEAALIIIMKARELGIPPIQAFSAISVINGKPCISAEMMLNLIYRNVPGSKIEYLDATDEKCTIEVTRPGHRKSTWSFSILDAKKAELMQKQVWKQYPGAMLRARTISAMARAVFPDALAGASYTPEELGAEVTQEGEVIEKDVTPLKPITEVPETPQNAPEAPKSAPNDIDPPKIIYAHMRDLKLSNEEMKSILERVFLVQSFRELTEKHLIEFNKVKDNGFNLLEEYHALLEMDMGTYEKEELSEAESSNEVEKTEVNLQQSNLEWGETKQVESTPPPQEPIEEAPSKHRNMAKGLVKIPESFPTIFKFKLIQDMPRKDAEKFLEKTKDWPATEELTWMVNSIKEFWGI
jgi:hypothetical protein